MSWDGYLDEYLGTAAKASALASRDDFAFYAASPSAGEAGWGHMYAAPANQKIEQDDGTEKDIMIDEAATIKDAVGRDMKKDGPSATGLWIGGKKYKVVNRDPEFEVGDYKLLTVAFAGPNKTGGHIICSEKSVLVALFDEKDEAKPTQSGNCKNACLEFVKYMVEQGL